MPKVLLISINILITRVAELGAKISDSRHRLFKTMEWNFALEINGNRGEENEICFNKGFKRNCTISTGIPNSGVWCRKWSNWTSAVGFRKKIRLLLPVLLGIRLHPKKTLDPSRLRHELRLWHRNAAHNTDALRISQLYNKFNNPSRLQQFLNSKSNNPAFLVQE